MSDDRFKQARRSLIDRNKQRQEGQGHPGQGGDDQFHEDEKTQMVNIDQFGAGQQESSGPPGPPPTPDSGGGNSARGDGGGGYNQQEDQFAEAATQMVDINDLGGGPPPGAGQSGPSENTAPAREALSIGGPSAPSSTGQQQQVLAPGGGGHEGKTDFINISDFAQASPHLSPDTGNAGYEGKTDFISIDALQGGQPPQMGGPAGPGNVVNDQMLRQSYQFSPDSIQQGAVTLVFAQNPLGRPVVLRQVWAGDASQMPAEVRQRIGQLDALDHPRLVSLNGVVATQTGLWADLQKPEGYRLSAVLQQHGPQDQENVITWMKQIAEVLDVVHGAQLLYGNLTPDAIWIQEDNSVVVEPFDMLSFEKRGDLGPFGAPELKRPAQDQQTSPATDVYSLAAVAGAALTGLPFHPEGLDNIEDQKIAGKLKAAMAANPGDRPQTAGELAAGLKSGGFSLDDLNLDPSELDIKIVGAIAALLLIGLGGFMYWDKQQSQKARQQQQRQQAIAAPETAGDTRAIDTQKGGDAPQEGQAGGPEGSPSVAAPGAITKDSRLNVVSSYQINPPAKDAEGEMTGEEAAATAQAKRDEARAHIKQAEKLGLDDDKRDEYRAALKCVTTAIRLSGGTPSEADEQLIEELDSKKLVREYKDGLRKRVASSISDGLVGEAGIIYQRLSSVDYRAQATDFFATSAGSEVRTVHEPDKKKEDDD